jgi:hypothetical protein
MPRALRISSLAILALLLLAPVSGRTQQAQSFPDDSWIPQGMDALGHHASFHTDLTFDKSMLEMANGLYGDDETRKVIAKLRGISVHTFRYPEPDLYDPAAVDAVRVQYHDRGWKHLVTAQSKAASVHPGRTDLWIRFDNTNVEGMVLLVVHPKNVTLVAVNGTLSPLDLLHLRGHFGIPNFDGDDFVDKNG